MDTSIRTDPTNGELRKRCCCEQCGYQFWRSQGIAAALEEIQKSHTAVVSLFEKVWDGEKS
jgi:hypothetical protein